MKITQRQRIINYIREFGSIATREAYTTNRKNKRPQKRQDYNRWTMKEANSHLGTLND